MGADLYPTGCPKIDGPLARVTYYPRPHRALRQNCHVGLLHGGSAEGNGSVGDKASNGERVSNSAAVKLRPDMSQDIFQQDLVLAHTVAKIKRWCQDNFPDV